MTRERVTIALPRGPAALREAIVERARRRGFHRFLAASSDPIRGEPGEEVLLRDGDYLISAGATGTRIALTTIGDAAGLDAAARATPDGGVLAIEWSGDRVIPLENAIAARGRRHSIWVYAHGPAEVSGALGALEHGADRVLVEVRSTDDVDALERIVEGPLPGQLEWTRAPVTEVRSAGLGDRVLVDTTSILAPEEGLLVGSAAAFLFHIASEAVGSRFSRPRPFRVNAGAAHSYILMADGSTRYLSELEPGEAVLVARPEGTLRSARVGRVKIERRPLVMVQADDAGAVRTVFLQEAETVRLSTTAGRVATTAASAGLFVLAVRLPPARHLGRAVEETIEER
ncbi:MAG: 3-dehydroquinate synthase II [Thermoplasmata archaeon]